MALSLSLLIGSITILATTLFQGRAMAPSMLCKPFLPIVRQQYELQSAYPLAGHQRTPEFRTSEPYGTKNLLSVLVQ